MKMSAQLRTASVLDLRGSEFRCPLLGVPWCYSGRVWWKTFHPPAANLASVVSSISGPFTYYDSDEQNM